MLRSKYQYGLLLIIALILACFGAKDIVIGSPLVHKGACFFELTTYPEFRLSQDVANQVILLEVSSGAETEVETESGNTPLVFQLGLRDIESLILKNFQILSGHKIEVAYFVLFHCWRSDLS